MDFLVGPLISIPDGASISQEVDNLMSDVSLPTPIIPLLFIRKDSVPSSIYMGGYQVNQIEGIQGILFTIYHSKTYTC